MDINNDIRFERYYEMMREWNERINLTAITQRDEVYLKHFSDSILPQNLIPEQAKVMDIGSGAGLPAIPLKLIRDDLNITMVDSVSKKIAFLNAVIAELGLNGIQAIHTRIEDVKEHDFDVITSRAVAPLNTLAEYSLPFLKHGGFLLAYKSAEIGQELSSAQNAIHILGGIVDKLIHIPLNAEINRSFVLIKKVKNTPEGYPRSGNKPRLKGL